MTQLTLDRIERPDPRDASPASTRATQTAAAGTVLAGTAAVPPGDRRLRRRANYGASARAKAPMLRPAALYPVPGVGRGPVARARSCVVPGPGARPTLRSPAGATWRLTERGVAVVLVAGLMIMVAALTVVGLTAMKVTGDRYQPTVSATLPR